MIAATEEMVKSQFIEMFYNDKYPLQKLNTHIDVIRGVSYKPTDVREGGLDGSSVILRSNNIDNGQINFDDVVYVDDKRVSKEQLVSKGDIVMCGSNGSKKLVGKAAMIDSVPAHQTSFGAFCLGIKCKETIHPKFLSTYFQTSKYRDVIEFLGSGSNILNIKPEHIFNLELPVPSIEEQRQFVFMANQADKSISELRKSIDAIDKVIKSLINENL
jgi:type I restriction enzyme S subunit